MIKGIGNAMGDDKDIALLKKILEHFNLPLNSKVVDFNLRSNIESGFELNITLINPVIPVYTMVDATGESPPPF